MERAPTIADIRRAAERLAGHVVHTPLVSSPVLDERVGGRVLLKCETLQRTGSFKFRGAYNAIDALGPSGRANGVVAVSSGNHGQGVAEAARLLGPARRSSCRRTRRRSNASAPSGAVAGSSPTTARGTIGRRSRPSLSRARAAPWCIPSTTAT